MAWTYSDWVTYDKGTATRLSRLRLHMQEVSDELHGGEMVSSNGTTVSTNLTAYLNRLTEKEVAEEKAVQLASGARVGFTRGVPL